MFMVVLSVQLVFYAFHEFTEGGLVPGIDNAYWHLATEDMAEGVVAQSISILMVAVSSFWLIGAFWKDWRRARMD